MGAASFVLNSSKLKDLNRFYSTSLFSLDHFTESEKFTVLGADFYASSNGKIGFYLLLIDRAAVAEELFKKRGQSDAFKIVK